MRQGKLAGNQGTFWHSRKVEGDEGDLEGTLELSGGTKLPLTVNLVKEKGDWRIHGIDINLGGMQQ